ncbi:MAG: ATP-binding protein [Candidatus Moranbacteria bacterium]|nr:ATP-binding protein [Candidatus Moranbacteria bacterium]
MIKRHIEDKLIKFLGQYPVVMLTGPRQSGKTTLCKMALPDKPYVSLENPENREYALSDPKGFLSNYPEGVIIDEAQHAPELFSYIQGIVDEKKLNGMFVLTGSQNFQLLEKINQSLAGRTAILKLLPFSIGEIAPIINTMTLNDVLLHGFYPRIYDQKLQPQDALSFYFETYVERDVRSILNVKDLFSFQKFVKLCAGRTGQLLHLSSLGNEAGVSHTTAREWLSLLEASYIVFLLPPYYKNFNKRITKSSKLYFYDVGLASYLLGIQSVNQMQRDPLRGNLFENLIVIEFLKKQYEQASRANLSFFRDSNQNEVDLIIPAGESLLAVEIKSGQTVTLDYFKGLKYFSEISKEELVKNFVIYGGDEAQNRSLAQVIPWKKLGELKISCE